jgi:hypothetical protein
MTRALACLALLLVVSCSSVSEPEPAPMPPELAQADSIIAANQHNPMFMTEAGAAGTSDPECAGALRDYAFVVAAYGWALNAVRQAPTASNIAWAAVMALAVVSAQANVYTHCSTDRARPA